MNLIPREPAANGNYYCTWGAQGAAAAMSGGAIEARDTLDETFLFSENGMLAAVDPAVRGDLILVADDGWDVPYRPAEDETNRWGFRPTAYGSCAPDAERFPSLSGTPAQRLRLLSEKVKSYGFRGLGLWISPTVYGECERNPSAREARAYWRERMTRFREAGILYLKVDWGQRAGDADYRRMMTETARECAPGLLVEHSLNQGKYDVRYEDRDPRNNPEDAARERFIEEMQYCSDCFRVYDCIGEFTHCTAISRAAEAARAAKERERADCVINMEDSLYGACGLGGTFGVMRCGRFAGGEGMFSDREIVRAVMWNRISPPFPLREGTFEISEAYAHDEWMRGDTPVLQDCPQMIARNMPLPVLRGAETGPVRNHLLPYVVCSRNPRGGAVSLFAAPRTVCGRAMLPVRADIALTGVDRYAPLGLFGFFREVRVNYLSDIRGVRVWAQDLAGTEAADVTDSVVRDGQTLVIPGTLAERLCLTAESSPYEMPGLVLVTEDE